MVDLCKFQDRPITEERSNFTKAECNLACECRRISARLSFLSSTLQIDVLSELLIQRRRGQLQYPVLNALCKEKYYLSSFRWFSNNPDLRFCSLHNLTRAKVPKWRNEELCVLITSFPSRGKGQKPLRLTSSRGISLAPHLLTHSKGIRLHTFMWP